MTIDFNIDKDAVMTEVAQTTSYTGDKMQGDDAAYDRIFTTDEDRSQLERFWNECCTDVCEVLKNVLGDSSVDASGFHMRLELNASWDPKLQRPMEKELFSYFVTAIAGKWFVFTNKEEAADYAKGAQSFIEGVHRKAVFKRKPTRPVY